MSKSYSDLRFLGHRSSSAGWAWDVTSKRPTVKELLIEPEQKQQPPRLTLEGLPVEVLGKRVLSYFAGGYSCLLCTTDMSLNSPNYILSGR